MGKLGSISVPTYDVRSFEGYKLAVSLESYIREQLEFFPKDIEEYNMIDQLIRCSNSITEAVRLAANVGTLKGMAAQLSRAIGSAKEVAAFFTAAKVVKYIPIYVERHVAKSTDHIISILTKTLANLLKKYGKVEGINSPFTSNTRKLIGYQKGMILVGKVYEMLRIYEEKIPKVYRDRSRRAVCSIVANLSEANVPYFNVKRKRLMDVKMACEKLQHQLDGFLSWQLIPEKIYEELTELSREVRRITNGILSSTYTGHVTAKSPNSV